MTEQDVQERVEEIRRVALDYEDAHGKEDDLYRDVLQAIADGSGKDPMSLAQAALKTQGIEFQRVCA